MKGALGQTVALFVFLAGSDDEFIEIPTAAQLELRSESAPEVSQIRTEEEDSTSAATGFTQNSARGEYSGSKLDAVRMQVRRIQHCFVDYFLGAFMPHCYMHLMLFNRGSYPNKEKCYHCYKNWRNKYEGISITKP